MAATYSFVYLVNYNASNSTYTASGPDLTGPLDETITDDIANGASDNPGILGDVSNDVFTGTLPAIPFILPDGFSETGTYLGTAINASNGSSGFLTLAHDGQYYYVTNTALTDLSGSNGNLTFQDQPLTLCFMRGTMIRTPEGELPVEALKCGDRVITTDGRAIPARWIGRQTVSMMFADPLRVGPIRIKAGALGEAVPARDLLLSPDHAILVEGVFVQAGALVNGISIVRENNVPDVFTYYHVEVDDHSLILAENVPAETFIDNVDRLAFDNWQEHEALYPEGKPIVEMPYPRAKAHRQVPLAIREHLAERAAILVGKTQDVAA